MSQNLSGSGGLTKLGAGTLLLTGANTYSGGTTINGGTLSVGADANLGDLSGGLNFDGGILRVTGTTFMSTARAINWAPNGGGFDIADAANIFTVAQALTGAGGLSKLGPGTLVLSGANTYAGGTTIAAGVLVGSTTSFGTGGILDNAALVFDQSTDGTFAAPISGTGSLTKQGAGALALSGVNPLSGPTTVEAGGLVVNGSLANSVVTVNGGTLGGTGIVGGLMANGGTVAPGNSIGTLSVAGNVAFGAPSTYEVEVNAAGQGDRIDATGTATLQGGPVQVLARTAIISQHPLHDPERHPGRLRPLRRGLHQPRLPDAVARLRAERRRSSTGRAPSSSCSHATTSRSLTWPCPASRWG